MAEIIGLPDNFIGKEDREKLESFGGHEIAYGRSTRWSWGSDEKGDHVFELFRGGADEELIARISRDRRLDTFIVRDDRDQIVISGSLDHIMAELDRLLAILHGETSA